MTIFRNYFSKSNTLISTNETNNSQNPVTEIAYGSLQNRLTRFIFDVELENLIEKINDGVIIPNSGMKHVLRMTNTIRYAPEYVGSKSYSDSIDRASSFDLDVFNVSEDWDEGSSYDFIYTNITYPNITSQVSNWIDRKTDTPWSVSGGSYVSGITEILGTQRFEKGNENLEIDVTDYINYRLFGTGTTFTGETYGLGVKFNDDLEALTTEFTQAVAFHAKNTNTWYEPFIETTVDDTIIDDRNYFYQDKDNDLYLYVNVGGIVENVTVNSVNIYDHEDNIVTTLTGDSIQNVSKGVYKISLNVSSNDYPDAIMFRDEWDITINGRNTKHENDFYLISSSNYYDFNRSNEVQFDNYFFHFWGISEKENLTAGNIRKIKLTIKELYSNQDNFLPLEIEYRLFTTVADKYEIEVIPFTSVNRTNNGYDFNLDTSWLIPQDYKLQIRMKNGNYYENKETLSFSIVSNKILN